MTNALSKLNKTFLAKYILKKYSKTSRCLNVVLQMSNLVLLPRNKAMVRGRNIKQGYFQDGEMTDVKMTNALSKLNKTFLAKYSLKKYLKNMTIFGSLPPKEKSGFCAKK